MKNGEAKKSQADKKECLAKTQVRIDKGDASVAKLGELVATLSKEVAEFHAAFADATAFREKEKAEFVLVEKIYIRMKKLALRQSRCCESTTKVQRLFRLLRLRLHLREIEAAS